jgi:hypothetical protein
MCREATGFSSTFRRRPQGCWRRRQSPHPTARPVPARPRDAPGRRERLPVGRGQFRSSCSGRAGGCAAMRKRNVNTRRRSAHDSFLRRARRPHSRLHAHGALGEVPVGRGTARLTMPQCGVCERARAAACAAAPRTSSTFAAIGATPAQARTAPADGSRRARRLSTCARKGRTAGEQRAASVHLRAALIGRLGAHDIAAVQCMVAQLRGTAGHAVTARSLRRWSGRTRAQPTAESTAP